MASDRNQGKESSLRPRTRAAMAKKRSLESSPSAESSPEKRLKCGGQQQDPVPRLVDEPVVEVQKSKCLDYLFRLDDHVALIGNLSRLDMDLDVCKDCLEHLNAVITKAQKMQREGSDGHGSETAGDQASTESSSDISSSSDEMTRIDRRRTLKSLIQTVYASEYAADNDYDCRFVGWRKLRTNRADQIQGYGFLELTDAQESDTAIWNVVKDRARCLAVVKQADEQMDSTDSDEQGLIAKYSALNQKIFKHISEPFEALLKQETEARCASQVWKSHLSNTRELCDVCGTAIFNGHYGCSECGFIACLECMSSRQVNMPSKKETSSFLPKFKLLLHKDSSGWPYCFRLNLKSLVFLIKDKYPSADRKQDLTSFNVLRKLSKKVAHSPDNLVFVQLIPPAILDSVQECFKRAKMEQAACLQTESQLSRGPALSNEFLVLDACSTTQTSDELLETFDANWELQKPIVFRNLHRQMDSALWKPDSFSQEFGKLEVDLINCRNHCIVPRVLMETFWLGFEDEQMRLLDFKGEAMILKLKDWPTSDDFKAIMPCRYKDLMDNLPVKLYTSREGFFNMASSLTDRFNKPDLGPKLYIAYSSAKVAKEGTTNLHVDISDALNLMMYVGQAPSEISDAKGLKSTAMYKLLVESKCDQGQVDRFLSGERPGAIWQLFHPKDADTIRTFCSKVAKSKSQKSQGRDPIHDQINYIDAGMLKKLKKEYSVDAFTIVQFLGDAIFIPAGAPHQVRNLNSCIKVAEDFVSPQGIEQCLQITSQLRRLSEKHLNHEDKLQIKNILYHKMKECLSFFCSTENW